MAFLIGVIILIIFIVCLIVYFRYKIRLIFRKIGFTNFNLAEVIRDAKIEDQEIPKSLSSMDSIYVPNIKKDFPDLNINELKAKAEQIILDVYNSIEKKNSSGLKGKIKSFTDDLINDFGNKGVKFNNLKFHKTVISNYKNSNGIATIEFGSSFEYNLGVDSKNTKIQDRVKVEFIYVIDIDKVSADKKALGINCPNCGSPIKTLGDLKCSYCGTGIKNIYIHSFTCNNIVRY